MKDQAIEKLRDEMASEAENPYIGEIGEYLCDYVKQHPRTAEAILQEGKTITGAVDAMRKVAEKRPRKGDMAMIGPEEGFKIVREYFGLDNKAEQRPRAMFGVSLDDLLED